MCVSVLVFIVCYITSLTYAALASKLGTMSTRWWPSLSLK